MTAVDLIIFGASGDLSARKLFPALFQLERLNLLQKDLRIAAVARTKQTLDEFLPVLKDKMSSYMGDDAPSEDEWTSFTQRFSYVAVNFSEPDEYGELREWLDDERVSLFYFATPPSLFAPICEHLSTTNCLAGDCRIVVEKPIGENLASSINVNEALSRYFDERRSTESTTIWVKKRSKIYWFCDSRTVSSIANGTTPALITFRSR